MGGSVLGWGQNNKNRANLGFHGNLLKYQVFYKTPSKNLEFASLDFFLDTANPKSWYFERWSQWSLGVVLGEHHHHHHQQEEEEKGCKTVAPQVRQLHDLATSFEQTRLVPPPHIEEQVEPGLFVFRNQEVAQTKIESLKLFIPPAVYPFCGATAPDVSHTIRSTKKGVPWLVGSTKTQVLRSSWTQNGSDWSSIKYIESLHPNPPIPRTVSWLFFVII